MKYKDIEKRIKEDISFSAPKTPLKTVDIQLEKEGSKKNRPKYAKAFLVACICVCLIFGVGIFSYQSFLANAETYISFSVNPAFEIEINGRGIVKNIFPLNNDAQKVCEDIDFKNKSLDKTLDMLIEKMVDMNYIEQNANININALGNNEKINGKMLEKAKGQIEKSLAGKGKNCNISTQCNGNGMNSPVKKELIDKILSYTDEYEIKDLQKYSVKQLRELLKKFE